VSCDDDAADEDAPDFREPPHPDDRIWRHPSEMDDHPIAPIGLPIHRVRAVRRAAAGWPWWRVAATSALGIVVVLGGLAVVFLTDTGGGDEASVLPGASSRSSATADRAGAAAAAVAPSVVRLEGGSGVVIRDDGLVLTSATLVDGPGPVPVWLHDGTAVEAAVVGVDGVTSIAVLDLPGDGHRPADLAPRGTDLTGPAYSVCAEEAGGAEATAGVVGTARKLNGEGAAGLDGVVEVEGEADPSAIGGPVVAADGTVLGVTTAIGSDRSSYFTPIDVGQKVAGDLLGSGAIRRSWLGIEGMDRVEGAGLHATGGYGAEVVTVAPGSPAEAAGIEAGDVIVALDGQPIERMPDLIRWLQSLSPGDRVEVAVDRSGERLTRTATLGERTG
jgi:S1-C subfamily serine protease